MYNEYTFIIYKSSSYYLLENLKFLKFLSPWIPKKGIICYLFYALNEK